MLLRKLREDNIDDFIDDILKEFDVRIKNWKKDVSIKNKNIQIANVEQPSFLAYYDEIKVDLKSLIDYYDMRVKQIRSEALQTLNKHSTKDYGPSEKEKIIDSDPKFLKYKRIYLEINEMHNLLCSISEQFKSRAFTLNNIIKIRTASLEDITLYDE